MSILKTNITLYSNEQNFIKNFIQTIIANSNNKITCPDYNSIDFSSSTSVSFTLCFLGRYNLSFKKDNNYGGFYTIKEVDFDEEKQESIQLFQSPSVSSPQIDTICQRNLKLTLLVTENLILLKIANQSPIIFIDTTLFEAQNWNSDSENQNFNLTLTNKQTSNLFSGYQYNRFPYKKKTNLNNVELSYKKTFVDTNSTDSSVLKSKVFDTGNLFIDCSYIPKNMIIEINNQKYYSLNNYLLIPAF